MLPECLMNVYRRKSSIENFKPKKNAPKLVRKSDTRLASKPRLKISTYQQSRGNRFTGLTKWRDLIRKGAKEYVAKIISEAEQKRAQRKARAKASPTELSSSDISCSISNMQFRAKIGLISHLRTHN